MGLVIDHHFHCVQQDPNMPKGFRRFVEQVQGEVAEASVTRYEDPGAPEALLDEAGIDYSVILAETNPVTSAWVPIEFVASFCQGRQRFIPFASINPYLVHNPAGYLRRLAESMGFRGLKLYPTYQYYYPNDTMLYSIYSVCQEMGLPVMLHTGSSVFPGSRPKYGPPIYLDDVAVDFPDLNILMCHSGRPAWWNEAFMLARLHANVYVELSGLPPRRLLTYFPELERVAHKTIYGSDWPGVPSLSANIQAIRQLPVSDDAKSAILGDNAARIHGLRAEGGCTA